ncbi:glycosyltransferase family 2 protein [Aestuariimicrobium sp. p3-SID1156]|uniref:glycosyltransferase family A protein n=1 Tax=Aestuariimicrobium sp. p3-SID1156 TaxID=2916038 RepID=UPI00223B247A|nr:glycosyltransferase family A protein [Aestuariimicrobium sp. p3-SID1156]MCT1458253.1 glycosyltransferase family 2 protein [Aestuariimicrobium sp. p3-SID1156]
MSRTTVAIPCFNDRPEHVRRAVDSALAQDSVEVVVVDDGSTRPETIRALDGLRGVRLIRTENRGPAAAINSAIAAGSGDFVLPMGADDYLDPGHIAPLALQLQLHPDTTIACAAYQEFECGHSLVIPPPQTTGPDMAKKCTISAASMFRRSDWEMLGGFHEQTREIFEDWEFWVRLLLQRGGVAQRVPTSLMHYRIKASSLNKKNHTGIDVMRTTREVMLEANPNHALTIAQGMCGDYEVAYFLGQNQSPIAQAATEQATYWARRYGKLEALIEKARSARDSIRHARRA